MTLKVYFEETRASKEIFFKILSLYKKILLYLSFILTILVITKGYQGKGKS